jgi:hypothetical protein
MTCLQNLTRNMAERQCVCCIRNCLPYTTTQPAHRIIYFSMLQQDNTATDTERRATHVNDERHTLMCSSSCSSPARSAHPCNLSANTHREASSHKANNILHKKQKTTCRQRRQHQQSAPGQLFVQHNVQQPST